MSQMPQEGIERAATTRAKYLAGLLWHIGAFVIINAFFWLLDLRGAGGVSWAFWITIMWGFAVAFHALAYAIDGRVLIERKAQEYIEDEQKEAVAQPLTSGKVD